MSTDVGRRYADALVELASEKNILETVSGDLDAFGSSLADSRELRAALKNPGFSVAERQAVVGSMLDSAKADGITRNFLYLLVENGRMEAFGEILSAFEQRVDDRLSRVRATVSSAVPLGSEMLAQIEEQVKHLTGKNDVLLTSEVDPSLIGGIVTRVGDLVLDGSIRTQLSTIRNQLLTQAPTAEA